MLRAFAERAATVKLSGRLPPPMISRWFGLVWFGFATPYDQQVTNVNFLSNRHFLMIRVAVVMIAMITDNHQ